MDNKISLTDLLNGSAYTGAPELVSVPVNLDGTDMMVDVYVRKLSYLSVINDGKAFKDNPDLFVAGRIAACVVDKDGNPMFESVEQIQGLGKYAMKGGLKPEFVYALFNATTQVNPMGKVTSNSTNSTNSGTNLSSTELEDEQLPKLNETSLLPSSSDGQPIERSADLLISDDELSKD